MLDFASHVKLRLAADEFSWRSVNRIPHVERVRALAGLDLYKLTGDLETFTLVPHLDPEHEADRAQRAFESHLSRAKWMTEHGFRHLLRGGASPIAAAVFRDVLHKQHATLIRLFP
jgi:hypothetical protein